LAEALNLHLLKPMMLKMLFSLLLVSLPVLAAEPGTSCLQFLSSLPNDWSKTPVGIEYFIEQAKRGFPPIAQAKLIELKAKVSAAKEELKKQVKDGSVLYKQDYPAWSARFNPLDSDRKKIKADLNKIDAAVGELDYHDRYLAALIKFLAKAPNNALPDYASIDHWWGYPRHMNSPKRKERSIPGQAPRYGRSGGTSNDDTATFLLLNQLNILNLNNLNSSNNSADLSNTSQSSCDVPNNDSCNPGN
jgi:hypothetical protein